MGAVAETKGRKQEPFLLMCICHIPTFLSSPPVARQLRHLGPDFFLFFFLELFFAVVMTKRKQVYMKRTSEKKYQSDKLQHHWLVGFLGGDGGGICKPNQQCTLNKLPTELQCRNIVNEHRPSIQICAKHAKTCTQCVYIFRLSLYFAFHYWWLGGHTLLPWRKKSIHLLKHCWPPSCSHSFSGAFQESAFLFRGRKTFY